MITIEETENIMKIVKLLEESGLPRKRISETFENEEKKEEFFYCY